MFAAYCRTGHGVLGALHKVAGGRRAYAHDEGKAFVAVALGAQDERLELPVGTCPRRYGEEFSVAAHHSSLSPSSVVVA
jgi:hypothetical protein